MTGAQYPRRTLRLAGTGLGAALAALGALKLWQGRSSSTWLLAAGAVVLAAAALAPSLLRPLVRAGSAIGTRLVSLVSQAALVVVYFLVVTPTAAVARLFGTRFTDEDFSRRSDSYWVKRESGGEKAADYEKQY